MKRTKTFDPRPVKRLIALCAVLSVLTLHGEVTQYAVKPWFRVKIKSF